MDFPIIEKKWQKIWDEANIFRSTASGDKPKYYVLEMLPYPSGKIHVGHLRNYAIGDVLSRFLLSKGYNVLHPMGWDAFGLPAENAAIANKSHPADWTYSNIDAMRAQLKSLGLSYDWEREISSCDSSYYKHEQKFFLELFSKGLAYQKESIVCWDPVDQTVLANEQVVDGRGWRSGALVERKHLKQWFLKITDYAEELLSELDNLDGWPESVRSMQEKWIGKSQGAYVDFKLESGEVVSVFTTCPETLFGASFVAVSYDHPIVHKIEKNESINEFIEKCRHMSLSSADIEKAEKDGIYTGIDLLHPLDGSIKIPLLIANYVLMEYGTGAVFGCPAHDERDHILATKMNLPVKQVIKPDVEVDLVASAYTGDGIMVNSEFLNGKTRAEAKIAVLEKLEEIKSGYATTHYRLRDWGISRQRFWGCPIPIIYCPSCGILPVPYENLPVELPVDADFNGHGNPLDNHPTWKYVKCHKCGSDAHRETDTFDTFFESSWYFTRYCDPKADEMTGKECNYWMPVDQYIGGIEHAVMHLLYARFFTKVMNELGYVKVREPFRNLLTQGMVLHATFKDKNGKWLYPKEAEELRKRGEVVLEGKVEKMSKSKNNVIDLESMLGSFGADTARMFVLSDSPPEKDLEWSSAGIEGCNKFINRLFVLAESVVSIDEPKDLTEDENLLKQIHFTIKNVTEDIQKFRLNKAIARIRELVNALTSSDIKSKIAGYGFGVVIRLLNPFIPHVTEEIWSKFSPEKILAKMDWPSYDEKYLVVSSVTLAIQVNGKLRATHEYPSDASDDEIKAIALMLDPVKKHIDGKEIRKVIIVPGKIVNIVC